MYSYLTNVSENYKAPTSTLANSPPHIANTADPKVWGPPFWFSLHVSAAHYPAKASPITAMNMKNRILAIPFEIPCNACRYHAQAFIEKNMPYLDRIVSSNTELSKFYVDFHNQVNKRYGKREWSYEEAYNYYNK